MYTCVCECVCVHMYVCSSCALFYSRDLCQGRVDPKSNEKRPTRSAPLTENRKSAIGSLATHVKLYDAFTFYPVPISGIEPKDTVPVQEDIHTAYVYAGVYNCEKLNTVFTPQVSDRLGQ